MAAGDSKVSICNLGLTTGLGQDPIVSLSDNRKAAILCNACYDATRREILRAHPWGFARKRAQLAAAVAQPAFGKGTAYTLPDDYIRLVDVPNDDAGRPRWVVEGRTLICDEDAPLDLIYVADCQDATLFDPLFVGALAYAIAAQVCIPLTQDKSLKQGCVNESDAKLASARLVSSQDNSPTEWDVDVLLRSRF
jgi:hypothetical protein